MGKISVMVALIIILLSLGCVNKTSETEEFQKILQLCLSLLPLKWRNAFHLKMMEECSGEEICKELDLTSSNLWVILHRAKLKLRECIEKNWIDA
jgi:RNA polymerase sigma-70 factor (ECF subfamily)